MIHIQTSFGICLRRFYYPNFLLFQLAFEIEHAFDWNSRSALSNSYVLRKILILKTNVLQFNSASYEN